MVADNSLPAVDDLAAAVDKETLTGVVRLALRDEGADLEGWEHTRLAYVNARPGERGLYRFSGRAQQAGTPWSLILKVVRQPPNAETAPMHPMYWKREVDAYSSGLLDDLPGIAAPRCLRISRSADETVLLWLEDVADLYDGRWPLERYGLAARHLGRFGGAYLGGRPLPEHDWLVTRATGPGAGGASAEERLRDRTTWEDPAVRRAFPLPIAERALRQREDRRAFRAAVAQLPRTLCHNDAHGENLFARRRADGTEKTVAVDWELVGLGPLATDITYLVIATLRRLAVDMADADRLEEAVFEGYVAGLRDAGWRGDEHELRLGYLAAVALRLGLIPQILSLILDRPQRERAERVWGRPADEIIERWAEVAYFVLDRADEARRLLEPR